MSFKGQIEAKCPAGCEPFTTEVWSFVNGSQSEDLRNAVLFRELNLIICPHCEKPFLPETTYVYYEPAQELLAFVMPESYRAEEQRWRGKMHEDFVAYRKALKDLPVTVEPEVFFGVEGLAELLEKLDYGGEEREVMEAVAGELGLSIYRVSPHYARANSIPDALPFEGKTATAASVRSGLEKLLAANDRLSAYADFLKTFKELPPARPG